VANHKSSKKRARQDIKKNQNNRVKNSETKSTVKQIREAISGKDKEKALSLLPKTQKLLDRLAKHGIIKTGTAGRKISRLSSQINKI